MKGRSLSNVILVMQVLLKSNQYIETVHEEKNSFKCKVYDATFSQKGNLNCHIESQTLHDLNDFFPS